MAGSDAGPSNQAGASATCQPLPCPSGAPWDPSRCACVAKDAGPSSDECQVASDCALVYGGCCAPCGPPPREALLAVPKSKEVETRSALCTGGTACGQCYVADPEPLASLFAAGCVEHRCELVDLRASDISSCKTDSDCVPVGRGCCPADTSDPADYVGIHKAADTTILQCSPVPPCVPPREHIAPLAFCAADGHCAVRRNETVNGKPSSDCYSPGQNLEHAYDDGAVGCDCVRHSMAMCRRDSAGRGVALECGERWQSEEDGPCYL
jgi:hypothetical protein